MFFLVVLAALMGPTSEATPLMSSNSPNLKNGTQAKLGSADIKTIMNDINKGIEFTKNTVKIIEDAYV